MSKQVGNGLEALYEAQNALIAGELAWHFRLAGLIPPAIAYLQIAAQTAVRSSAYTEGISHLRMAIDLLAQLPPNIGKTPRISKAQFIF